LLDVITLFEEVSPGNDDLDSRTDATPAGQALRQVLDEVDDIARATLGAITISTMLKQVTRSTAGSEAQTVADTIQSAPAGAGVASAD
jgi:hypothetical protein